MNYKLKFLTYAIWYILERFAYFYVTQLWCPIDHESIILNSKSITWKHIKINC